MRFILPLLCLFALLFAGCQSKRYPNRRPALQPTAPAHTVIVTPSPKPTPAPMTECEDGECVPPAIADTGDCGPEG